jgi:hypothetical protein
MLLPGQRLQGPPDESEANSLHFSTGWPRDVRNGQGVIPDSGGRNCIQMDFTAVPNLAGHHDGTSHRRQ